MKDRIEPQDREYQALLRLWTNEGRPHEVTYVGARWQAIRDGDHMVFVRARESLGIDADYASTSV